MGGGIHRLQTKNVFFRDQKLMLDLTTSESREWNMGLSLAAGLSAIFQKRIEVQLAFRYHFIQLNSSGNGPAPEAAKMVVLGLNLMRYF